MTLTFPQTIRDPRLSHPVLCVKARDLPFLPFEQQKYTVAVFLSLSGDVHYEINNPLAHVGPRNNGWFNLFFRRKRFYQSYSRVLVAGTVLRHRLTVIGGIQLIVDAARDRATILSLGILSNQDVLEWPEKDRELFHQIRPQANSLLMKGFDIFCLALRLRTVEADTSTIPGVKYSHFGFVKRPVRGLIPRIKRFLILFPEVRKDHIAKTFSNAATDVGSPHDNDNEPFNKGG